MWPLRKGLPTPVLLAMLGALTLASPGAAADFTLVPKGATWRYLDDGSDQGSAWADPLFDDSGWASGPAQLGYGDGDEATVVSYGPDAGAKYTTTYFRIAFEATGVATFQGATLELLRDDGAVVYLNGQEVHRVNMPGGTVVASTFASSAIGSPTESSFFSSPVDPTLLVEGTNVLAVEIHQANLTSSDISFDLALTATDTTSITRGPYLQMGTPTSIIVRWSTDAPTSSRVAFGASASQLDAEVFDATLVQDHELELSSLSPATPYFYGVGTATEILAGGDADHRFTTAPVAGTRQPIRIWAIGDSGTADANAAAVRDAFVSFASGAPPDVWLMLGDNAYNDGTDPQYQAAVFDMYPTFLQRTALWPTLGNHDGHSADSGTESGPYYDVFTLPRAGEAGGFPSGTEAYYSFDYGNVHFVCLDSYDSDRSPSGAMANWLADDLAGAAADWTITFWHHPPYSKGSHNSDSELALAEMRQNFLPILEQYGVDLVLGGHSHAYERSVLLDGHYGTSDTLQSYMVLDAGDGRPAGDGAYEKPLGATPHDGAVYIVAGSSGKVSSSGNLDHPVMYVSLRELGSLVLDVDGDRIDATFLDDTGFAADTFTLLKGASPACDNDGTCEQGEDCVTCPNDCVSGGSAATCGNGICEAADGEDCLTCPSDCRGRQKGKVSNQFCCGAGGGTNPVSCAGEQACSTSGWQCTDAPAPASCCGDGACTGSENGSTCELDCGSAPFCGDGVCDTGESACSCSADCGAPPAVETGVCDDGIDNDCDGFADCQDSDCAADAACSSCAPTGDACADSSECCSQKCRGKPGAKTCR